ncbi:hypothetical protein C6Y50_03045 [Stutzerimonas stutzeri]|nr:hypothetical protein C6Y50_03045 [Stutzerimonas stutzeri]
MPRPPPGQRTPSVAGWSAPHQFTEWPSTERLLGGREKLHPPYRPAIQNRGGCSAPRYPPLPAYGWVSCLYNCGRRNGSC